jgi:hypothetical protein
MSHSAAATLEPSPTPAPRGLYLVVPTDRDSPPPTFPRPPRLPRADPPDSTPTEATEKDILRSIKGKVDAVYQDVPRLELAQSEMKTLFTARFDAQGHEISDVRRDLRGVKKELHEVVVDVEELKKGPGSKLPSIFPKIEPGWNDIRARGETTQTIALEAARAAIRQNDLERDAKLLREEREASKGTKAHVWRGVLTAVAVAAVIGTASVVYVALDNAARAHLRSPPTQVAPR